MYSRQVRSLREKLNSRILRPVERVTLGLGAARSRPTCSAGVSQQLSPEGPCMNFHLLHLYSGCRGQMRRYPFPRQTPLVTEARCRGLGCRGFPEGASLVGTDLDTWRHSLTSKPRLASQVGPEWPSFKLGRSRGSVEVGIPRVWVG